MDRLRPEYARQFWQDYAMRTVRAAIRERILPNLRSGDFACVDCAGIATDYEHRDYASPLNVEPVCRSCNTKRGTAKWPSAADFNFKRIEHS